MSIRSAARKGFTLVEILIVVVILGILAAIVIPQFTNASEAANASSMRTQLQTLRSQLELYQIDHNGEFPLLTDFTTGANGTPWDVLTVRHNVDPSDGRPTNFGAAVDETLVAAGPYIRQPISNPFAQSANRTTVADANTTGSAAIAFTYNEDNGDIQAVLPEQKAIDLKFINATGEDTPDIVTY